MANRITKKMTVTCVSYGLCELVDGEMTYVEQPDLILKGIRSKDFVRKHLTKKHGADANVSIKNIDAGEHRFSMSLEDFVRAADVDVDEPAEEVPDGDPASEVAESGTVAEDASAADEPAGESSDGESSGGGENGDDGEESNFPW